MTASKKKQHDAQNSNTYRLKFVPDALKEWKALDGSVSGPLKKILKKRLNEPNMPGGELHGMLSNCYKIKLSKHGIRLVYYVQDEELVVLVLSVDKREKMAAYRAAVDRLVNLQTLNDR